VFHGVPAELAKAIEATARGLASRQGAGPSNALKSPAHQLHKECTMAVFRDIFASDAGLLSLAVIAFMLGMGAFFVRYFLRHMHEDEAKSSSHR
jgi:hypothetical protein